MARVSGLMGDRSLLSELSGVSIVAADLPCQVPCAADKICGRPFGWNKPHMCVHPTLIGRPLTEPVDLDGVPYLIIGAGFGTALAFFVMGLILAIWKMVKCCVRCVRKCRRRYTKPVVVAVPAPRVSIEHLGAVYDSIPRSAKSGPEELTALEEVPLDDDF